MPSIEANYYREDVVSILGYAAVANQPHYWHSTGMASTSQLCHQEHVGPKCLLQGKRDVQSIIHDQLVIEV